MSDTTSGSENQADPASRVDGEATEAHRPPKLLVNVTDLRRRLGQRLDVDVHIELAPTAVVGTRTTDAPVLGSVVVESIERGVSAVGSVEFSWEGDCRRCLEVTGDRLSIDIAEIFQIQAPEDSELIDFDGDQIDLVPIVHDAVVLSLPLAPLCRDDCAGPDPDRYPALTHHQAEEAKAKEREEIPDPRWAALADLDLDSTEN